MPAPLGTSPRATCQTARRRHSPATHRTNRSSLVPPRGVMALNEYKVVSASSMEDLMKKVDETTSGKVSFVPTRGHWTFIGGVSVGTDDAGIASVWSQAMTLTIG